MNYGCKCGSLDPKSDPHGLKECDITKANTCICDMPTLMNHGCQCKFKLSLPKINLLGANATVSGVILFFEIDPPDTWNSPVKVEMLFSKSKNKSYYHGTINNAKKGTDALTVSNNCISVIPEKNAKYSFVWDLNKDGIKNGIPVYMRLKLTV